MMLLATVTMDEAARSGPINHSSQGGRNGQMHNNQIPTGLCLEINFADPLLPVKCRLHTNTLETATAATHQGWKRQPTALSANSPVCIVNPVSYKSQ